MAAAPTFSPLAALALPSPSPCSQQFHRPLLVAALLRVICSRIPYWWQHHAFGMSLFHAETPAHRVRLLHGENKSGSHSKHSTAARRSGGGGPAKFKRKEVEEAGGGKGRRQNEQQATRGEGEHGRRSEHPQEAIKRNTTKEKTPASTHPHTRTHTRRVRAPLCQQEQPRGTPPPTHTGTHTSGHAPREREREQDLHAQRTQLEKGSRGMLGLTRTVHE